MDERVKVEIMHKSRSFHVTRRFNYSLNAIHLEEENMQNGDNSSKNSYENEHPNQTSGKDLSSFHPDDDKVIAI